MTAVYIIVWLILGYVGVGVVAREVNDTPPIIPGICLTCLGLFTFIISFLFILSKIPNPWKWFIKK